MISSVTFPKKGKGYIYEKPEKPGPEPNKNDWKYNRWEGFGVEAKEVFDKKRFDRDHKAWEEDKAFYDANKGKFICPAADYLIGKKFGFEPGKVNIIFGPNGCGKTTILRAIAGYCGIFDDGMTRLGDPLEVFGFDTEPNEEAVAKHIEELMKNTANVSWDGNVVYYNNFAHTERRGWNGIGELVGSALGSLDEEMAFRLGGNKASSGQKARWLFNKIATMQESNLSLKAITEDRISGRNNDTWKKSYKAQTDHFKAFENFDKVVPMTILFDEPEVNFDIPTVWSLYSEVFPKMVEKYGTQIITVSHSPIVLSDNIMNNEYVNIISMDKEYTDKVKKFLGKLTF